MPDRNNDAWNMLMDVSRLVDTALGLTLLADSECAESFCIPAERECAERAPLSAARVLLTQACALLDKLEPVISRLEEGAS